ncbi:MAG: hypothetical protein H0X24_17010 [Ktedonobacterales bacterium]|nr:hypothetical protein [Ktedonobacterales bacterium]
MQLIEALSAALLAIAAVGTLGVGIWQQSSAQQEKKFDMLHLLRKQAADHQQLLGIHARAEGDYATAKHHFLEALDRYAAIGDKANEYFITSYLQEIDRHGPLKTNRPNLYLVHQPDVLEQPDHDVLYLQSDQSQQPTTPRERIVS